MRKRRKKRKRRKRRSRRKRRKRRRKRKSKRKKRRKRRKKRRRRKKKRWKRKRWKKKKRRRKKTIKPLRPSCKAIVHVSPNEPLMIVPTINQRCIVRSHIRAASCAHRMSSRVCFARSLARSLSTLVRQLTWKSKRASRKRRY